MKLKQNEMRFRGVLLGTAVGDSLGLPAEGLSPARIQKLWQGEWRQRLCCNKGLLSDDTEHTIFVVLALLAHSQNSQLFARSLAWSLRWWLLLLPAGIGLATGRAILKLWLGCSPNTSGVFSAGNGPAMRVAPLGVYFAEHGEGLTEFVTASTRLTHSDPRALTGALAISRTIAWICREQLETRPDRKDFIALLKQADVESDSEEWSRVVEKIDHGLKDNLSVQAFALLLGCEKGVSGYIFQTVPVALYAWYHHFGDYGQTLTAVLSCGGDTDTVGAIVGALAGATVGEEGIPREWLGDIMDYPRTVSYMGKLADQLAEQQRTGVAVKPPGYFWPALILRNLVFLVIVLVHGFRRLLPPYS